MNDHDRIAALERRVENMEQCLANWRTGLIENTEATLRVESNTRELVELLKLARTGVSFFAGTGRVLRRIAVWCAPFLALAGAIWGVFHGKWPGQS